ncbi:MAG: calycin-like domain-containing protein [Treponemataceae bacterium]|nr:calycin-like domain-containing protein [Treponemataceae bacterium]
MLFLCFCSSVFSLGTEEVKGDYDVTFKYSMTVKSGEGYAGEGIEPVISIEQKENGLFDITLPQFFFTDTKKIGQFTIADVEGAADENGNILFALKDATSTDGNYDIIIYWLKGTVSEEKKLDLKVQMKVGKMPFKMTVCYDGTKQL